MTLQDLLEQNMTMILQDYLEQDMTVTLQDLLAQAVHNVLETQHVSDNDYHVSRGIVGRVPDDVDSVQITVCTHVHINQ